MHGAYGRVRNGGNGGTSSAPRLVIGFALVMALAAFLSWWVQALCCAHAQLPSSDCSKPRDAPLVGRSAHACTDLPFCVTQVYKPAAIPKRKAARQQQRPGAGHHWAGRKHGQPAGGGINRRGGKCQGGSPAGQSALQVQAPSADVAEGMLQIIQALKALPTTF